MAGEADEAAALEEAIGLLVTGGGPGGILGDGGEGGGGPGFLEEDEVGLELLDFCCDIGVAGGGGAVHPGGEAPDVIDEELEVGGGRWVGVVGGWVGWVPGADGMGVRVTAAGGEEQGGEPEQQDGSGCGGGGGPDLLEQ
ncbi:MAG: hypothetical protein RI897_1819 [Verrucomicrobiota bacterium]